MDNFFLCSDKNCDFANTYTCFEHYHLTSGIRKLGVGILVNALGGDIEVFLYTKENHVVGKGTIPLKPDFNTVEDDVKEFIQKHRTHILKTLGVVKYETK